MIKTASSATLALAFASITLASVVGCAPPQQAKSPDEAGGASSSSSSPSKLGGSSAGGAALANAPPGFKEALAKAKACEYGENGFDSSCEGVAAWESEQPFFEEGKSKAALLALLGSTDLKERRLGAERLRTTLDDATNAADVDKLLDAAAKEQNEDIARLLGEIVGNVDLTRTGKIDRALSVFKSAGHPTYGDAFVSNVANANKDPKTLAFAIEVSKSTPSLRSSALIALAAIAKTDAQACNAIDALRADPSEFVANRALSELARARKCQAHYDKILEDIAKRDVTKERQVGQDVGWALEGICEDKATTAPQRAKALGLAKKLTDAKSVGVNTRFYTMSAVLSCDPKEGLGYVKKFSADTNKTLADRAKTLVERSAKK